MSGLTVIGPSAPPEASAGTLPPISVTVVDVRVGPENSNPSGLIELGGKVLFSANDGYPCDGTPVIGTEIGDHFGEYGLELFAVGPESSVELVADVNTATSGNCDGVSNTFWGRRARIGGEIVFAGRDDPFSSGSTGLEPYRTQGNPETTSLLSDIAPGDSSFPNSFGTVLGGSAVAFSAERNYIAGAEPWITDGTADGTRLIADLAVGTASNPHEFTELDASRFVFVADEGTRTGEELYVSDGNGAQLVHEWANDNIEPVTTFAGRSSVVFAANDGLTGSEPWVSDGTASGTFRLADIAPGSVSSIGSTKFVQVGNKMFFSAANSVAGSELWVTDGTPSGTAMVKDLNPGSGGGYFGRSAAYQGKLYFSGPGPDLWVSDGTPEGTVATGIGRPIVEPTVVGDLLYFASGMSLWVTDGTPANTAMVADGFTTQPNQLTAVGSSMLAFVARDDAHGSELWVATHPDVIGPPAPGIGAAPSPATTSDDVAITATASDETTGGSNIVGTEYQLDGGLWQPMEPLDGAFDSVVETGIATVSFNTIGTHDVCVRGRDAADNIGQENCMTIDIMPGDSTAPVVEISMSSSEVALDEVVTATVAASDEATGGSNIAIIEYQVDGGSWTSILTTADGSYDSPTETATVDLSFSSRGRTTMCARGTDTSNNVGESDCADVLVGDVVPLAITITTIDFLGSPFLPTADLYARAVFSLPDLDLTLENRPEAIAMKVGDRTRTDWTFGLYVPRSASSVPIAVGIFDRDDAGPSADDQADINPLSGAEALEFEVDMASGTWSQGPLGQTCSAGQGGAERLSVQVCVAVSTLSIDGDRDGDALLDAWELYGHDFDGDGSAEQDLPAWGADPERADAFVEIDCLESDGDGNGQYDASELKDHTHCPLMGTADRIIETFANGDVQNVDGTSGVQLHLDVGDLYGAGNVVAVTGEGGATATYGDFGGGNRIPEFGNEVIVFEPYGTYRDSPEGKTILESDWTLFGDLKDANFDPSRLPVFRYSLWGHSTAFRSFEGYDDTSGLAERASGDRVADDHLVTLGAHAESGRPQWGAAPANGIDDDGDGKVDEDPVDGQDNDEDGVKDEDAGFSVGSVAQQAGTFIHELAHNFGLSHGGTDSKEYKPNHRSVLNYTRGWQLCGVTTSSGGPKSCDLSREKLPTLDESSFDECLGFDTGGPLGPVNANGSTDGTEDENPTLEGASCFNGTTNITWDLDGNGRDDELLHGSDDWANLQFGYRDRPVAYGNSVFEASPTPEMIEEAVAYLDSMSAPEVDVGVPLNAEVTEGETLVLPVALENVGHGPAEGVTVAAKAPDDADLVATAVLLRLGQATVLDLTWDAPVGSVGVYAVDVVVAYSGLSGIGREHTSTVNVTVRRASSDPAGSDPELTVDTDPVVVVEGDTATTSGTYSDGDDDRVTLNASVGEITDHGNGIWSWSIDTVDGPSESGTVTITADDGTGGDAAGTDGITTIEFGLVVDNAEPSVSATPATQVVDHNDAIAPVSVLATDVAADPLVVSVSHTDGRAPYRPGLPDGLTFTDDGCDVLSGTRSCVGTVAGIPTVPDGIYEIRISYIDPDAGVGFAVTTINVGTDPILESVVPARVLESRSGPNDKTVDGLFEGVGRRAAGSVTELVVTGRGGVSGDARSVLLNVTAVFPDAPGFLTVYPCGSPRPKASNVNYGPGDVVPNAVLAKVGAGGKVCIYTLAGTDIIADVNGYVPAR